MKVTLGAMHCRHYRFHLGSRVDESEVREMGTPRKGIGEVTLRPALAQREMRNE